MLNPLLQLIAARASQQTTARRLAAMTEDNDRMKKQFRDLQSKVKGPETNAGDTVSSPNVVTPSGDGKEQLQTTPAIQAIVIDDEALSNASSVAQTPFNISSFPVATPIESDIYTPASDQDGSFEAPHSRDRCESSTIGNILATIASNNDTGNSSVNGSRATRRLSLTGASNSAGTGTVEGREASFKDHIQTIEEHGEIVNQILIATNSGDTSRNEETGDGDDAWCADPEEALAFIDACGEVARVADENRNTINTNPGPSLVAEKKQKNSDKNAWKNNAMVPSPFSAAVKAQRRTSTHRMTMGPAAASKAHTKTKPVKSAKKSLFGFGKKKKKKDSKKSNRRASTGGSGPSYGVNIFGGRSVRRASQ